MHRRSHARRGLINDSMGEKTKNKRLSGEGNDLFQKMKTLFAATLLNAYILQLSLTQDITK